MHRIILDTDPGLDDALALFLALASPEVQLEAITTVSGNVHVDLTTRNALALLELTGRTTIPVARGCDRPIVRQAVVADYVHGQNGLGGISLPEPQIRPENLTKGSTIKCFPLNTLANPPLAIFVTTR